jgi:hypothetical protein
LHEVRYLEANRLGCGRTVNAIVRKLVLVQASDLTIAQHVVRRRFARKPFWQIDKACLLVSEYLTGGNLCGLVFGHCLSISIAKALRLSRIPNLIDGNSIFGIVWIW